MESFHNSLTALLSKLLQLKECRCQDQFPKKLQGFIFLLILENTLQRDCIFQVQEYLD